MVAPALPGDATLQGTVSGAESNAPVVAAPGVPSDATRLQGAGLPCFQHLPGQVSAARRVAEFPAMRPACTRHRLHSVAWPSSAHKTRQTSDLRCSACSADGWTSHHDDWWAALCSAERVWVPQRLPDAAPVRRSVAQYMERTFNDQDVPDPGAPVHVVAPLLPPGCCHPWACQHTVHRLAASGHSLIFCAKAF